MRMYFMGCNLMKTKPLIEKSEFNSTMFFQLLEFKQSQWRQQQQWHLTEGFLSTLAFIFLHIYSLLYAKQLEK